LPIYANGENENETVNETEPQYPSYNQTAPTFWENFASSIWNGLTFFWDTITNLWNGLVSTINLIVETLKGLNQLIVNSFSIIRDFIGNWGDIEAYKRYTFLAVAYPNIVFQYENNCSLGEIANKIIAEYGYSDLTKDLVDSFVGDNRKVWEIQPKGFLGMLNGFVVLLKSGYPLFEWVIKNIFVIHIVAILGLLVAGLYKAVNKKDFEPFVNQLERIYRIFEVYVKMISWIISRAIDISSSIAQWLDTIIPF
jgi:hypothetical protein